MGDQAMSGLLMYNHGGCENRGCEAIVRATSALFASRTNVLLASDQPQHDRKVDLPHVSGVISSTISPYSLDRLINSLAFRLGASRESEVARKYAPVVRAGKTRICLSIGGDTYCYGRPEHLYVINRRLKRAGRPMVLWGCSIEPDLFAGEMLEDLKNYDLIVARESITYEAAKAAGLRAICCCDPAFTLDRLDLPLPEGFEAGKTVGLNVSPLVLNKSRHREKALDAFCALVRHILDTTDTTVALIPHVTWGHDNDLQALGEIQARFQGEKRVFMLPGDLDARQVKGYIARLGLLVTARTHASIAAYSTGVPTLVIGYSIKARGIARDLYGEEAGHLIPVQELDSKEQLIAAFDALSGRAQQERSELMRRLPAYTASLHAAVDAVMALERP